MHLIHKILAAWAAVGLSACATVPAPQSQPQTQPVSAAKEEAFVIAANPLAAQAGYDVLKRGGSAVDAAVAVQALLSLVEPQSSGIGGGAFLNYYDARTGKISIYDGREIAPAQATPSMFLRPDGSTLPFGEAVLSGRATGVPGVVRMLAVAHQERGRLPWSSLFGDAERTARDGFIVSPRLARLVRGRFPQTSAPDTVAYFTKPDGGLVAAGLYTTLMIPPATPAGLSLVRISLSAAHSDEEIGRIVAALQNAR